MNYYNLKDTEFCFSTPNFTFFFSSQLLLDKFMRRFERHRKEMCYKLSSRFEFIVELDDYWDMILYKTLQNHRGFLVQNNKTREWAECLRKVKLGGKIVIISESVTP